MKRVEFVKGIEESLETSSPISKETNIQELEEWDSLTAMVLVNFVNESFGKKMKPLDLQNMTNIDSLMKIIGLENFED